MSSELRPLPKAQPGAGCLSGQWILQQAHRGQQAPPVAASASTAGPLLEERAATPGTCSPSLLILCVIV